MSWFALRTLFSFLEGVDNGDEDGPLYCLNPRVGILGGLFVLRFGYSFLRKSEVYLTQVHCVVNLTISCQSSRLFICVLCRMENAKLGCMHELDTFHIVNLFVQKSAHCMEQWSKCLYVDTSSF